jgi:hypothetical protein
LELLFTDGKAIRSMAVNPSRVDELKTAFPGTELLKLEQFQVTAPESFSV